METIEQQNPARRALSDVADIREIQSHGVFIKAYRVPAGISFWTKKFNEPHIMIGSKGSGLIEINGKKYRLIAPSHIEIPAHTRCPVTTLEECIWYCIHGTTETDIDRLRQMF